MIPRLVNPFWLAWELNSLAIHDFCLIRTRRRKARSWQPSHEASPIEIETYYIAVYLRFIPN